MKKVLILLLSGLVLTACQNSSSGDKFVGTWQNDNATNMVITISKSGDNYSVTDVNPQDMVNAICANGASIKDDKLSCRPDFEFSYDSSTGKLTNLLGRFTKIK